MTTSLHRLRRRFDVAALLAVNLVLLTISYTMPFMQASRFIFLRDEYTLIRSIRLMFANGHYVLGAIVFLFSFVFPIAKLGLLVVVWFVPMTFERRTRVLGWLAGLGKWSMLDVFIVAVLVVLISAGAAADADPLPGLYLFAAAIVLSIALTQWIQHLARRQTAA